MRRAWFAVPHANVIDHRIPHCGDQMLFWDQANWQTLCSHHHSAAKQHEEKTAPMF